MRLASHFRASVVSGGAAEEAGTFRTSPTYRQQGGLYRIIRHPQYLALAVLGLGTTLIWPRFLAVRGHTDLPDHVVWGDIPTPMF